MASDAESEYPPKFFARNMTANAHRPVLGNPVSARPESGVENSFPGLEFDTRALDRAFFPGLIFEFFQSDGITLVACHTDEIDLRQQDFESAHQLYLWSIAVPTSEGLDHRVLEGTYGMGSWRHIRALDTGPVAIVVGPGPARTLVLSQQIKLMTDLLAKIDNGIASSITRNEASGSIEYAILASNRNKILDEHGVIDVAAFPAGELTKTMCSPWVYDFQECFCFYWASNKPDITDAGSADRRPTNFIRADRSTIPPPIDKIGELDRRSSEISIKAMIEGAWQDLPFVIDDQESNGVSAMPPSRSVAPLSREAATARLRYLASVEHALMIEYLFAYYSMHREPDPTADPEITRLISLAAAEIYVVAVDEMRHFLWVNRILLILGESHSIARANEIRESKSDDPASGNPVRDFMLRPLSSATLQDFIDVERPSRVEGTGVDGLYVQLLTEFEQPVYSELERQRIIPLIKLIIDEGHGHFQRFEAVKSLLADLPDELFSRQLNGPGDAETDKYLDLCDSYYNDILLAIDLSLSDGLDADADIMANAVRSMHSMDHVATVLASHNVGPRFRIDGPNDPLGYCETWGYSAS